MAFRLHGTHWQVAMPKTQMSRFHIHDELTAPEASLPILKGALASAGQLPNFLGVLAGSPAALRGYTRFRGELRHGSLPLADARADRARRRRALQLEPGITHPQPHGAPAGIGIDEVALAREWDSSDERRRRCCATSRRWLEQRGAVRRTCTRRRSEAGWTDEQLLEAIAFARLEMLHGDGQRRRRRARRRVVEETGSARSLSPCRRSSGHRAAGSRSRQRCRPGRPVLPPLPRGGRAGRQALDRRDHLRPARSDRAAALLARSARRPAALGPAAVRADEGARGARDRRAPVHAEAPVRVEYALTDRGRGSSRRCASSSRWALSTAG